MSNLKYPIYTVPTTKTITIAKVDIIKPNPMSSADDLFLTEYNKIFCMNMALTIYLYCLLPIFTFPIWMFSIR